MNHNGRSTTREPHVARSIGGLAHDAIELAELQAKLFKMDVQTAATKARTALVLGVVGVVLLLGSVPVILFAAAEALVVSAEISRAAALSISAGVGIGVSILLAAAAWYILRNGISKFERSRSELSENIAWIKAALRGNKAYEDSDTKVRAVPR